MTDTDLNEHYIKQGDPKKPVYYIIRRNSKTEGLFFRFLTIAGHIKYALKNGWLPVVDMQNYPNPYLAPEKLGQENSWEYYFEQPLRIGLEQAYGGENVILSDAGLQNKDKPNWSMNFCENKGNILTKWRMLLELGLLKIKPAMMEDILAEREKLFAPQERVLGVLLRGTDYPIFQLAKHPIPPPPEFAASTVSDKLREWKCDKIFLATEDKYLVNYFKDIFKDLCIVLDREYVDYNSRKAVSLVRIDRENDHFLQGKEYLTQITLLSMCTSFVAARCSGTVGAMILAKRFEKTFFFDLGSYTKKS